MMQSSDAVCIPTIWLVGMVVSNGCDGVALNFYNSMLWMSEDYEWFLHGLDMDGTGLSWIVG